MSDRLFDIEPTTTTVEDPLTPEQREEYRRRLAEKLKDPEFRKIEGFPIGTDEAILALSDPPYYTACPNPFLEEWLAENAKPYDPDTDDYHREPFAADVSEGKNHPIYNAHSYHTKVPHRAIMRYILHYTEPGDVVYDGFCGTGMTGVAAQLCGDKTEVEALGSDPKKGKPGDYKVDDQGNIWERATWESYLAIQAGRTNPHPFITEPKPFSKLGARKAILNDLSPAATFIAYNYNTPVDAAAFEREAKRILNEVEEECGWMYSTLHREEGKWTDDEWEAFVAQSADGLSKCSDAESAKQYLAELGAKVRLGRINYMVWSDVLLCPQCGAEIVFWDAAVDKTAGAVLERFPCLSCRAETTKGKCDRKFISRFDDALGESIRQSVQVPVLENYSCGKKRHEKAADEFDSAIVRLIERLTIPNHFPTDRMPDGQESRRNDPSGLTHVHHFFTRRNRAGLAYLTSGAVTAFLRFGAQALTIRATKLNKVHTSNYFHGGGGWNAGNVSGTLYVPSTNIESSVLHLAEERFDTLIKFVQSHTSVRGQRSAIQAASATASVGTGALDYIFTDPPFGGNLNYSELSFIWEAWLGVVTDNKPEAITNSVQGKGLPEYQALMTECFRRYHEALKSGRWMTVEFHNSADAVWNAIHEALERVGFVVADVRVIDKQQYSFKQVTTSGATKKDLVISCYKPKEEFVRDFERDKGTPQGVRDFLEQHLAMLPVAPITSSGKLEQIVERTLGVLYDRMIAYHLVQGAPIPLSAVEFEKLLAEHFFKEDGMWFLPNQLAQYQARKLRGAEPEQFSFYVQDEKSAVRWIRAELEDEEQTLGELTPKFMRELKEWPKTEPRPELRDLMKEYFVQNAEGTWAIPDPENEEHLATLRRNQMLKLFRGYATEKGKLGSFRKEAVIEGFKHCWQTKQYHVIVHVCLRMKRADLQADRELLQFYDIANDMTPEDASGQLEFVWE
jgi:DNA modification methylase